MDRGGGNASNIARQNFPGFNLSRFTFVIPATANSFRCLGQEYIQCVPSERMKSNKIQGYRNSKRMAVNGMVERLCKEEDVGYMDLWDSFVGNEDMYVRDGLHLSGKGAAVFAEGLSGAVASGLGKVRYLN